jgi:chitodextrinase
MRKNNQSLMTRYGRLTFILVLLAGWLSAEIGAPPTALSFQSDGRLAQAGKLIYEPPNIDPPEIPDRPPPVITSGPTLAAVAPDKLDVTWTTNQAATSEVQMYGQVYGSTAHVTSHRITVPNMMCGVGYADVNQRVRSRNAQGEEATATIQTFVYLVSRNTKPPSELKATNVTSTSITINWKRAEWENCFRSEGLNARVFRDGNKVAEYGGWNQHTDSNLTPNTRYTYTVEGYNDYRGFKDQTGQDIGLVTTAKSAPLTVQTSAPGTTPTPTPTGTGGVTPTPTPRAPGTPGIPGTPTPPGQPGRPPTTCPWWRQIFGRCAPEEIICPLWRWLFGQCPPPGDGGAPGTSPGTPPGGEDTIAPSAPLNLRSPQQTVTTIYLEWDQANDTGSGIANYRVYRDDSLIGGPKETRYTDAGLTANTSYRYFVRAIDKNGNVSPNSNTITVKTKESFFGPIQVGPPQTPAPPPSTPTATIPPKKTTTTKPPTTPAPAPKTGPGQPAEPKDTQPPKISNVSATADGNSFVVTWQTDEAATSIVDYGTTSSYGLVGGHNDSVTDHTVTVYDLTPQTTYHFRVRSQDAAGNESASEGQTVTTTSGISVQLPKITAILINGQPPGTTAAAEEEGVGPTLDSPGQQTIRANLGDALTLIGISMPNANLTIYILSQEEQAYSAQSDAEGRWEAQFEVVNLLPGEHNVEVESVSGGQTTPRLLLASFVVNEPVPETTETPRRGVAPIVWILGGLVLVALVAGGIIFYRRYFVVEEDGAGDEESVRPQ